MLIVDVQALEAAWEAACKVQGATLKIPEFQFLINPLTLQGPCMPNFVFQVYNFIYVSMLLLLFHLCDIVGILNNQNILICLSNI